MTRTVVDLVLGPGLGAGDDATLEVRVEDVIESIAVVDPGVGPIRGRIRVIGVVVVAMMMMMIARSRVDIGDRDLILRRGIKRGVIAPNRAHIQGQGQEHDPDPETPAESIPRNTTAHALDPDRVPPPTQRSPHDLTRSHRAAVPAPPAAVAPDPDQSTATERRVTLPATRSPHHRPHTRSQRKSPRSQRNSS